MYSKDVMVQNQVGLHARPATFFIQKANEFRSSIWIEKEERRVKAFCPWESLAVHRSRLLLMVQMNRLL